MAAIVNTTPDNLEWIADYSGLRCPVDDRGSQSLRDRPFALGSNSPEWENGSANKAVLSTFLLNGGTVEPFDGVDASSGKLDIPRLNKYVFRDMLYGMSGDAKEKKPFDLMSFRGYPTPTIKSIKYNSIELNQDIESIDSGVSTTSTLIPNQIKREVGTSLPISAGSDYVLISGELELSRSVPFDSVYIALKEKIGIEHFGTSTQYDVLYSEEVTGDFIASDDYQCKTECIGDGSGTKFYFRLAGEIHDAVLDNGSDFSSRYLKVKLMQNVLKPFKQHAYYGLPTLESGEVFSLYCTHSGGKWVGSSNLEPDNIAPTTPTGLHMTGVSGQSLEIAWTPSTDNIGVTGYVVEYKEQGASDIQIRNASSYFTSLSIERGKTYEIRVKAKDAALNYSSFSATLTINVPALTLESIWTNTSPRDDYSIACNGDNTYINLYVEDSVGMLNGTDINQKVYSKSDGSTTWNGDNEWWLITKYQGEGGGDPSSAAIRINQTGDTWGHNSCV